MNDETKKVLTSTMPPRIALDAERVLGGLADERSQTAVGGKPAGVKPPTNRQV